MKAIFLSTIFILFFHQQVISQKQHFLSIRVGYDVSGFLNYDDNYKSILKSGFDAGIRYHSVELGNQFHIVSDINYMQIGGRIKKDTETLKVKNNYLQFALKSRYYFRYDELFGKGPGYYFDIGPYASYLLTSKQNGILDGINYDDFNSTNLYKSWDYGINLTFGLSALQILFIELNYNIGFANINNSSAKNHFVSVNLIISYGFFKTLFQKIH